MFSGIGLVRSLSKGLWGRVRGTAVASVAAVASGLAAAGARVRADGKAGGSVFCWGSAQYNQLGLGDARNRPTPSVLGSLDGEQIVDVDAGLHSSAAVTAEGDVYTWGRGQRLVLGHGDKSEVPYPRKVDALRDAHIKSVSISEFVAAAVDAAGRVYTWGSRALGREGSGPVPEIVEGSIRAERIVRVACGQSHCLAVADDGSLFAWGHGYEGALGLGGPDDALEPVQVPGVSRVRDVACGKNFSLVVVDDGGKGKLLSFGTGDFGQTAQAGNQRYTRTPTPVRALERYDVTRVAAGVFHSACIAGGDVYTWGYGKDGQCGHGDRAVHSPIPRRVKGLEGETPVGVACGDGHTAVMCQGGSIYIFGRGRDGQLGRGDQLESMASYRTKPLPVPFFSSNDDLTVQKISLGGQHSVALVESRG